MLASVFGGFFDRRLWTTVGAPRRTVSHEEISEDTALNYSAVWCATRLLCGTGASLPLPVFSGRDTDEREKERTHPVYRLLNGSPNPEQTAYNFRSVMWQWQVNWGNAYAEIVREGNNPYAPLDSLWPLHPSRVHVCRREDDSLYYQIQNFGGEPTELEPWQVLHIPSIITYDGLVGHGVIAHARETVGAGIAAEKKAAASFGGQNVPAVVVETAGSWNEEARKAFRKEWKDIHSGADGDTVALLQGGATAKALGFNAQDSQFLESRQFDIEEIARWYGIPPHLLQHLLRATFNNVEELGIDFVRYGLNLWLKVWEQCIWQKLFTPDEQETYFAEHNVDALMRGNAASRAEFYRAMTSAAIMTRNQCMRLENLPPVPGGDTYLVQGATVPLDDDGKPESEFASGASSGTTAAKQPAMPSESDSEDDPAQDKPEEINEDAANHLFRASERRLKWTLTKETKALAKSAKNPQLFGTLVTEFYAGHSRDLEEEFGDILNALLACGVNFDPAEFISDWVREGKTLAMRAAESTVSSSLASAFQVLSESPEWVNRPIRAIERVKNATVSV